ncbi:hypothetical protein [uncultured Clostridium sp.]|uniref:hypothetical protein n=1 Tax=uncultured Clostridium sp. TaxID=59620 RepID=UPI00263A78BC|nr:hypothetical protein [uncultured Clostridium sp.]
MTKQEAYEAMQEGYPVAHKDFGEGEFIYMDQNFFIRDENGNLFESTWDVRTTERWEADWYIFKNKQIKRRTGPQLLQNKREENENLISHIQGNKCPGKLNCLQYIKIAGESACLICDCNDNENLISSNEEVEKDYIKQIEYNNEDINVDIGIAESVTISKEKKNNWIKKKYNISNVLYLSLVLIINIIVFIAYFFIMQKITNIDKPIAEFNIVDIILYFLLFVIIFNINYFAVYKFKKWREKKND